MNLYRVDWQGRPAYAQLDSATSLRLLDRPPWEGGHPIEVEVPLAHAKLLAPVQPSKIVAAGLNYRIHAQEMGMPIPSIPLIFLKPPTALADPGSLISWPAMSQRIDFEGELAVVIGKTSRHLSPGEAADHIWGHTLANDVTARDLQKVDGQWTRAKGFDGFCPVGPSIVSGLPESDVLFHTRVNGEVRQTGRISDMIFSLAEIVAFVSSVMTLWPGDLILTGTPSGIGTLQAGDRVSVESASVGILENTLGNKPSDKGE